MKARFLILLFVAALFTGCIESGSFNVPGGGSSIQLPDLMGGDTDGETGEKNIIASTGDLTVSLKMLPSHFSSSSETGSYSESFTLAGLPSARIVWRVEKDPFEKVFQKLADDSNSQKELLIDGVQVKVEVENSRDIYRISTHQGIYTFIAETDSPEDIENARAYGSAAEVVGTVFEAGLENAFAYDLESLRN